MTQERIIEELREIIFDYQDTMTKDVEQSIKNLISQIEVSKKLYTAMVYRTYKKSNRTKMGSRSI